MSEGLIVCVWCRYVFPLDDMAAVCGFEAFINGKHIKAVVKEKEKAHRCFTIPPKRPQSAHSHN